MPIRKYSEQDVLNAVFDDTNNAIKTNTTVTADIEIGAVEIKNATDDTRATVTANGLQVTVKDLATPNGDSMVDDTSDALKVTQATAIAGEDIPNDVLKVEQRFSGSVVTADTLVKSGAGFLHTLTFSCNDAAPTAGSIIVYDNTAESGTILYSETFDTTAFRGYSVILDVSFTTGLYIGFTTTADVNVTPSYR